MLQHPGRESIAPWRLDVRYAPSADAPVVGYIRPGGRMRVGIVRPDGWFTVVRPADGRVIGYATVSVPATTGSRAAVPEPSAADSSNIVERLGPFALMAAGLALGVRVARAAVRRRPRPSFTYELPQGQTFGRVVDNEIHFIAPPAPASLLHDVPLPSQPSGGPGTSVPAWPSSRTSHKLPTSEPPPWLRAEILCIQAKCYKGWVRTATVDRLRGAVDRYRRNEAAPRAHVSGVLVTARDQVDELARDELTRHELHHECIPPPTAVWSIVDDEERGKEYEKFVGGEYRQRGYLVEPRGLERGMDDDGLDLICVRSSPPPAPL